jgi:hypothetical protein
MRALGLILASALAPACAGIFVAVEAMGSERPLRARASIEELAEWVAARHRPRADRSFAITYRIPLVVDRADSHLDDAELEAIVAEMQAIWRQAGICFAARDHDDAEPDEGELVVRFVSDGEGSPVYGGFDGHRGLWSLDHPELAPAPHPAEHPAARTASHEIGHALGLGHQNGAVGAVDRLMASGHHGFVLEGDEIARARWVARQLTIGSCDR